MVKKKLAVRIHKCLDCKAVLDRDYNASLNILSLGLENYRRNCGKSSLSEIEPIPRRQALVCDAGSPHSLEIG